MQTKLHFVQIILIGIVMLLVFFAGQGTSIVNNCPQPIINNYIDVNVITPPIEFDANMFSRDQNFTPNIIVNVKSDGSGSTDGDTYVTNNYFEDNNQTQTYYDFSLKALDVNGNIILNDSDSFLDGTSALDAMNELSSIEYTQYSFGVMIISIEGVTAGDHEYWALYTDGNYSPVGISDISIDKDTSIEWRIESW